LSLPCGLVNMYQHSGGSCRYSHMMGKVSHLSLACCLVNMYQHSGGNCGYSLAMGKVRHLSLSMQRWAAQNKIVFLNPLNSMLKAYLCIHWMYMLLSI
jgi:hypothetical protein